MELDDSFEHLGSLDSTIRDQIGVIWAGLEADPYYIPPEAEYSIERRGDDYTVCQHINGWLGWSLVWFWEYSDVQPSTPEYVVLMLEHQAPPQPLHPKAFD